MEKMDLVGMGVPQKREGGDPDDARFLSREGGKEKAPVKEVAREDASVESADSLKDKIKWLEEELERVKRENGQKDDKINDYRKRLIAIVGIVSQLKVDSGKARELGKPKELQEALEEIMRALKEAIER